MKGIDAIINKIIYNNNVLKAILNDSARQISTETKGNQLEIPIELAWGSMGFIVFRFYVVWLRVCLG